jgi:hypothetical protein
LKDAAPWILDMEPVMALRAPLREYGIYKLALHNLREFRDRVIPLRMRIATLYDYLKAFIEPEIIYINENKERQDYLLEHEKLFQARSYAVTIRLSHCRIPAETRNVRRNQDFDVQSSWGIENTLSLSKDFDTVE